MCFPVLWPRVLQWVPQYSTCLGGCSRDRESLKVRGLFLLATTEQNASSTAMEKEGVWMAIPLHSVILSGNALLFKRPCHLLLKSRFTWMNCWKDWAFTCRVSLLPVGEVYFSFFYHVFLTPYSCCATETYRFWNDNSGCSIWFVKWLTFCLFYQLCLWMASSLFYLLKETFRPCRQGLGTHGGLLGGRCCCRDSYLPAVPEWREGRANELMSEKCFEDEKPFSCVSYCSY